MLKNHYIAVEPKDSDCYVTPPNVTQTCDDRVRTCSQPLTPKARVPSSKPPNLKCYHLLGIYYKINFLHLKSCLYNRNFSLLISGSTKVLFDSWVYSYISKDELICFGS